ncbi:MAG: hypothetical protein ABEJ95_05030 [Candidatus Nanohalobium sp.]
MQISKNSCRKIASVVFLTSTLLTTYFLNKLEFSQLLAFTGGIFTGSITAGIWLETSYRFLVKEATAPLDKLVDEI